jgi:hypothetical protein
MDIEKLKALALAANTDISACARFTTAFDPAAVLELIAEVERLRAARGKREIPPEMKAAIDEAHKTGKTAALLPNGSAVFINYGDQPEDTSDLCCTACGGSGHIDDQKGIASRVAPAAGTEKDADLEVVREALDIAHDLAIAEADHVHETYKGYKPHRHEAVDRDVETVKRAIAIMATKEPPCSS